MLDTHFENFLKELEYLKGISKLTVKSYRQVFARYKATCGDELPTKANLNKFVVAMREKGLAITSCNIAIRSFNSFLTYLEENGHERLRIKQLKEHKKRVPDVPLESLKRLAWF
jgi:site-specific recombinase XerD